MRAMVLNWLNSNKLSFHLGTFRIFSQAKIHFWWPTLTLDVKSFVAACSMCARNKTGNQPPTGLLLPLLTPSCLWSHISLDFVMCLPPLDGNTTILTINNSFSKVAYFIPFPNSAFETALLLVQHIFRIHGILSDVLSDHNSSPKSNAAFARPWGPPPA